MTGAELRDIRLRLGLTQEGMGRALELTRTTISRYERRGRRQVPRWLSLAAEQLASIFRPRRPR